MSQIQQLEHLIQSTKTTLALELSNIIHHHDTTPATHDYHHRFQYYLGLLDPIHAFIQNNREMLPPHAIQTAKNTMATLKNTIFEVESIVIPQNSFDLDKIYHEAAESFADMIVAQDSPIAVEFDNTLPREVSTTSRYQHHDDNKATEIIQSNSPTLSISSQKSGLVMSQHSITDLERAFVVIMTLEQFHWAHSTHLLIDPSLDNSQIRCNQIIRISPNNDHTQTDFPIDSEQFIIPEPIRDQYYQSILAMNQTLDYSLLQSCFPNTYPALIIDTQNQNVNEALNPTIETPNPTLALYYYICSQDTTYHSQVLPAHTLQPPLQLKQIRNSIILQLHPFLSPIQSSTFSSPQSLSHFNFASVMAQDVHNSIIILPCIDFSFHMTTISNSLIFSQQHQLRLHGINNALFCTAKSSQAILSHNFNAQDQLSHILPVIAALPNASSLKLEPIIEHSQRTLFTPFFPTILSSNLTLPTDPQITPHLHILRSMLLDVHDFDALLQHENQKANAQSSQLPRLPTNDTNPLGFNLNYQYLDQLDDETIDKLLRSLRSLFTFPNA